MLSRKQFRSVVYIGADSKDLQSQFQTSNLKICDKMVDLADAGRTSDLAITNGNLGTTTAMLLSGVPVLALPLHVEQLLMGKAVERVGAGAAVSPQNLEVCEKALTALTSQTRFRESAEGFADRYGHFSLEHYQEQIAEELDSILRMVG